MDYVNPHLNAQLARLRRSVGNPDQRLSDALAHAEKYRSIGADRRVAWLTAAAGRLDDAETLLNRTEVYEEDAGNAAYAVSALRLAAGNSLGAREASQDAVRKSKVSDLIKSEVLRRLDDMALDRFCLPAILDSFGADSFWHEFDCFALPAEITPEEIKSYARFMEYACPAMGQNSDELKNLLEDDKLLNGESYWYHVGLGHYSWLNRDRKAADHHYQQSKIHALRDGISPIHYNCGIMTWLPEDQTLDFLETEVPDQFEIDQWSWHNPNLAEEKPDLVILVGCDTNYFRYFPKLLLSLILAIRGVTKPLNVVIHISIAEASSAQIRFLEESAVWLNDHVPQLSLSFAAGELPSRDPGLYTCIRFLALPKLLQTYDSNVVILDIDSAAPLDFFSRLDKLSGHDFALRQHNFEHGIQVRGEPWSINASEMFISNSSWGRKFARFMRNFIQKAFDPSLSTTWTIDQSALGLAYDRIVSINPSTKIYNLANHEPITVMPHLVGGKEALLALNGVVTIDNFFDLAASAMLLSDQQTSSNSNTVKLKTA
jgi:hypothetical protein